MTATPSVYDAVVGQEHAVAKLRALAESPAHAYLFVGPPGCGKEIAARAFIATRLQGSEDPRQRTADLVMRGIHVDVHELEREGASISMDQARDEVVKLAPQSAVEGRFRTIVVHEVHLLADDARTSILKTIEEPGADNMIVLLAEDIPEDFSTIVSRCVRIDFGPIADEVIVDTLTASGVTAERARDIARIVAGDLSRARILVRDESLVERSRLFSSVPFELDGTASRALRITENLLGAIEDSLEAYKAQHVVELAELEERAKFLGERGLGRAKVDARHKRELRRHRTDEIRSGLRIMTLVYADALKQSADTTAHHLTDSYVRAVKTLRDASVALNVNVNERLLLENLLLNLPTVPPEHR